MHNAAKKLSKNLNPNPGWKEILAKLPLILHKFVNSSLNICIQNQNSAARHELNFLLAINCNGYGRVSTEICKKTYACISTQSESL